MKVIHCRYCGRERWAAKDPCTNPTCPSHDKKRTIPASSRFHRHFTPPVGYERSDRTGVEKSTVDRLYAKSRLERFLCL